VPRPIKSKLPIAESGGEVAAGRDHTVDEAKDHALAVTEFNENSCNSLDTHMTVEILAIGDESDLDHDIFGTENKEKSRILAHLRRSFDVWRRIIFTCSRKCWSRTDKLEWKGENRVITELNADLGVLKRQQRALQLVTAARQIYNVIMMRIKVQTARWFMYWRTILVANRSERQLSQSCEYQLAMEEQLSLMTRCLALSRVVALTYVHRQRPIRNIVQVWKQQVQNVAVINFYDTQHKLLQEKTRIAEQKLFAAQKQIDDLDSEVTRLRTKHDNLLDHRIEHHHSPLSLEPDSDRNYDAGAIPSIQSLLDSLSKSPGQNLYCAATVDNLQRELNHLEDETGEKMRIAVELRAVENALYLREEELEYLSACHQGCYKLVQAVANWKVDFEVCSVHQKYTQYGIMIQPMDSYELDVAKVIT